MGQVRRWIEQWTVMQLTRGFLHWQVGEFKLQPLLSYQWVFFCRYRVISIAWPFSQYQLLLMERYFVKIAVQWRLIHSEVVRCLNAKSGALYHSVLCLAQHLRGYKPDTRQYFNEDHIPSQQQKTDWIFRWDLSQPAQKTLEMGSRWMVCYTVDTIQAWVLNKFIEFDLLFCCLASEETCKHICWWKVLSRYWLSWLLL